MRASERESELCGRAGPQNGEMCSSGFGCVLGDAMCMEFLIVLAARPPLAGIRVFLLRFVMPCALFFSLV